jgi:hypothetical protein
MAPCRTESLRGRWPTAEFVSASALIGQLARAPAAAFRLLPASSSDSAARCASTSSQDQRGQEERTPEDHRGPRDEVGRAPPPNTVCAVPPNAPPARPPPLPDWSRMTTIS